VVDTWKSNQVTECIRVHWDWDFRTFGINAVWFGMVRSLHAESFLRPRCIDYGPEQHRRRGERDEATAGSQLPTNARRLWRLCYPAIVPFCSCWGKSTIAYEHISDSFRFCQAFIYTAPTTDCSALISTRTNLDVSPLHASLFVS
jgi:hypothetical protein